jgi:uncharacterized membrane protein YhiD involved in acid resistance
MTVWRSFVLVLLLAGSTALPLVAQQDATTTTAQQDALPGLTAGGADERTPREAKPPSRFTQLEQLQYALLRLPIAAGLATALAVRPRRRGTPRRQAQVIQTQIILSVVGAVVMLVVGTSLARAFGIVGAAGLVRYRAKIEDPKDAGVMLSTLAIGLASGVGLWMLALFATVFILGMLWVIESFEPQARQLFTLKIKAEDALGLKPKIDEYLTRQRLDYELRSSTKEEVCYEVRLPLDRKTDRLSAGILKLEPHPATGVEWEEKKEKK